MVNAGRVGLVPKGEWKSTKPYTFLDVVTYQNKGYIAKENNIPVGTLPTDENYFMESFSIDGFAKESDLLNLATKAEVAECATKDELNKLNDNPIFTGSISLGRKENTEIGANSVAEGNNTTASGIYSHAEGLETIASGAYSHAQNLLTIAIGESSHAEGYGAQAIGKHSHAEGMDAIASGIYSHAEGMTTFASGESSHAEGDSTTASGICSHAEGDWTTASGNNSHAQNLGTIASSDNQTVIGKFNIEDTEGKYAFIIGNGTDDSQRSNALAIKWDGTIVTSNF